MEILEKALPYIFMILMVIYFSCRFYFAGKESLGEKIVKRGLKSDFYIQYKHGYETYYLKVSKHSTPNSHEFSRNEVMELK